MDKIVRLSLFTLTLILRPIQQSLTVWPKLALSWQQLPCLSFPSADYRSGAYHTSLYNPPISYCYF